VRVHVTHFIDDLADDCRAIAVGAPTDLRDVVQEGLKVGNTVARDNARRSAGTPGKHYPDAFSWEMTGVLTGEYGPDVAKPQGGMSFEFGSRNQKPHLDLAKSADLIGPSFAQEVGRLAQRWFWP
jgi:hypothetical protein